MSYNNFNSKASFTTSSNLKLIVTNVLSLLHLFQITKIISSNSFFVFYSQTFLNLN